MVVSMQHGKDNPQWQELGRTRLKLNQYSDSNCYSLRKVPLDFHFELTQTIKIDVYTAANDEDDDEDDALDAFQGSMMCLLSELCAAPDRTVSFPIEQKPSHSLFNDVRLQLDVTAEKVEYQNSSLRVKLKGEHFRHVLGSQGKEKYYVCVCRTHARQGEISKERAQKLIIHSTEAISFARKSSLPDGPPPSWRSFEVNMLDLCDGDVLQSIIVEIWMQNTSSGQPHLVGEICTTVQDLLKAKASATLPVPGSGSLPAKLVLQSARMITRPTFLDFIHGGCQLSLLILQHTSKCFDMWIGLCLSSASVGPCPFPRLSHEIHVSFLTQWPIRGSRFPSFLWTWPFPPYGVPSGYQGHHNYTCTLYKRVLPCLRLRS